MGSKQLVCPSRTLQSQKAKFPDWSLCCSVWGHAEQQEEYFFWTVSTRKDELCGSGQEISNKLVAF